MPFPSDNIMIRSTLGGLGLMMAALPAGAIVRWNEGKDQIFVKATAAWVYDSNIYTSSEQESDGIMRGTLGMEYRRQAGLIGVNADVGVTIADFSENTDESFSNPNMRLEFTKDTGRTTGTIGFNANRASRADPAANMRTDSWNYGAELRLKYPVSERHTFSGGLDWRLLDYTDNSFLVDLDTTSLSADWYYVFTEERDLIGGYRLRLSETSAGNKYADHSISGGIAGRLIRGLNGNARVGYQVREDLSGSGDTFSGYNATISGTWNLTKTAAITARLTKDFSTTSTNITTDTTTGNLDFQYARSAQLVFSGGAGAGITRFLGDAGNGREDTYFNAYVRAQYTFSQKLIVGASYSYFRNWSTQEFSDFTRDSITFDASSRF